MNLEYELQKLGLSDKEAKVYLASLELGTDSVQNIGKKAGVNRATTYVILSSLLKQGLVSTYDEGKKTYYIATPPESLSGLLEVQKKEIEERQKYLQTLLPQLNLINNRKEDKPVVKFYEGKQGMIASIGEYFALERPLKDEDNISRGFFSNDLLVNLFDDNDRAKLREMRINRKAKFKGIYNADHTTYTTGKDAIKIKVPGDKYPFPCDISIYGDTIKITTLGDKPSGILITDPAVATALKSLYELAWKGAESISKIE